MDCKEGEKRVLDRMEKQNETEKKDHWYCFTYEGKALTGEYCKASAYTGYPEKINITRPIIDENKKYARVQGGAVLLNCIYLGEMSNAEFQGNV